MIYRYNGHPKGPWYMASGLNSTRETHTMRHIEWFLSRATVHAPFVRMIFPHTSPISSSPLWGHEYVLLPYSKLRCAIMSRTTVILFCFISLLPDNGRSTYCRSHCPGLQNPLFVCTLFLFLHDSLARQSHYPRLPHFTTGNGEAWCRFKLSSVPRPQTLVPRSSK